MAKTSQNFRVTRAVVEALEQRVLYSADGPFDLSIPHEKQLDDNIVASLNYVTSADSYQQSTPSKEAPASSDQPANDIITDGYPTQAQTEIVFVDLATPDAAMFAHDIQAHASDDIQFHIIGIEPGQNGLDLITETLAEHTPVAAVHIISHGDDGQVQLGAQVLDSTALTTHGNTIKEWRSSLRSDADILIYGCDVAATATGQQFVAALAQMTGADIAASKNLTGHSALGGDWTLEYVHGVIEAPLALSADLQNSWQGTLDITSNLVAHYQFEDSSGTTAIDSIGNADAALSNGATFTNLGQVNNALIVTADSGGDSLATIPNAVQFDVGSDDFTVAFWFNTDSLANQIIFHHDDTTNGQFISTTATGQLVWSIDGSLNTTNVVRPGLLDNTWYHVTATRTGDTFQLTTWDGGSYVSQSTTQAMGSLSTTADLLIGGFNGLEFDGRVDDFRFYNGRALSGGDITELHNYTAPSNNAPTDLSSGIELNTDGGNDTYFAAITAEPVFGSATQRTVEMSLQLDNASGTNPHFLTYWTSSQLEEFEIALSAANEVTVTVGGTTYVGAAHPELRDGDIHQLAVAWDSTTGAVVIYIDGQFSSSGNTGAGYVLGATGALDIGQGQTPTGKITSEAFAGTFYDIRVWDEVRTANDIASNYQRKLDPTNLPAALVANFQFDGFDAANIIEDQTSINNGLSTQHSIDPGFTSSTPVGDLNVDENPLTGTTIGFVVPTDLDAQANFTFDLTDNPNGRFVIDSITGEIKVADGSQFNYESANSNNLEIKVTDATGKIYRETMSVAVNDINEAPIVSNSGGTTSEGQYVTITPAMLQATDIDTTDGPGNLTFSLTNVVNGQIEISGAPGTSITSFTQAQIDAGQIVFLHDGSETTSAGFDYSVADGLEDGVTPVSGTFSFTVNDINDAPAFFNLDNNPIFVEDAAAVILDADVTIFDAELSAIDNFDGATLYIGRSGGASNDDAFSATGILGPLAEGSSLIFNSAVIGTVNVHSGGELVLQFNSSATNSIVNGVMQSVAYSNSSDMPPASVNLHLTFNDNNSGAQGSGLAKWDSESLIVDIDDSNDKPVIDLDANDSTTSGIGYSGTFVQGTGPVAIADSDSSIIDPDNTTLSSMAVSITNLSDGANESLSVSFPVVGWSSTYISSTGVLSITPAPASTHADWETVIESIQYNNTSATPTTTTRIIEFNGSDGTTTNLPMAQSEIAITLNQSPVISSPSIFAVELTEDNGPAGADVDISVLDSDSPTLASAVVAITSNYKPGEDSLTFTNQPGITGLWNAANGSLTLTGPASVADYQTALRSVQVANNSQMPNTATRVVSWTVNDGISDSNTITREVNISPVNDAPVFNSLPDNSGHIVDSGISGASSTSAADINGDGIPDLITTSSTTGNIVYYQGDGSGNFGPATVITNTLDEPQEVSIADLDGDGDADLIAADYSTTQDNLVIYSNDGNGNFTETILDASTGGVVQVETGDLDGDGDIDIAANFWFSSEVVWYENLGAGSFNRSVIDTGAGGTAIEIVDINLDGDADIIASFRNSNSVVYYQNDGSATSFTATSYAASQAFDIAPGDFDNDGDIDLAYIGLTGAVGWLQSSGSSNPVFTHNAITDVGRGVQISAADVNNDGNTDLLATRDTAGEFVLFDNDGTGQFSQSTFATASSAREIVAADLDNDGNVDIITSAASSADVQVFDNHGSGEFTNYTTNEDTAITLDPVSFTDIDAGISPLQSTIVVTNGTITLSDTTGLSFSSGDGNDDPSLIFTGPATDINSALNAIQFQPDSNFNGTASIDIEINDQGNTGAGGSLAVSTTLIVDVIPVNDSPLFDNNTGAVVRFGDTLILTTAMLHEGDPDDDGADLTFTVVSAPTAGHLAFTTAPAIPVASFSQADIDSGKVIYVHTGSTTNNDSFDLELADDGADGSVAAQGTFTITLTGALADNYTTDEDTPLFIPAITGVLANDAKGVPFSSSAVAAFNAYSDDDGDTTWTSDIGTDDLSLGTGVTHTTSPPSPLNGIAAAFVLNGSDGITGPALHGFSGIDGQSSATLETWIRFDALHSHQVIFDTGNSSDSGITVAASGSGIDLAVANGGQLSSNFGGNLLLPDTWHHIALTIDMDAITPVASVWVDGTLEVQVTRSLDNWAASAFGLGTTNGTSVGGYSGNVEGQIASFQIHDEVLDSTTIDMHYTNAGAGTSSPFVATSDTTSTGGSVTINADGSFSYDPDNQFEALATGQSTTDTFTYGYDDGSGNSELATVTITVNGVNDSPALSNIAGDTLVFTEDDPAAVIDQSNDALISDIDNADFDGAILTAAVTTGAEPTEDIVSIRNDGNNTNQIGYGAGTLKYSGIVIATVSGGTNGTPLTIAFNSNATATSTSAALRNVTYRNTDTESPSTGSRTIEFKFADPEFAATTTHLATVSVNSSNDLPTTKSATSMVGGEDRNKLMIAVRGTDIDGTVEFIRVTSLPANGKLFTDAALGNAVTINTDYTATAQSRFFYFVPDADWNGTTSFNYVARDNDGGLDATAATGTYVVPEVNDTPERTAGSVGNLNVLENSGTTSLGLESITYSPGGGNDESAQNLTYTVTNVPDASLGSITITDGTTVATGSMYTLAQLQSMQFTAATNTIGGSGNFSFQVTDNGTTDGIGDPQSLTETLSVTVSVVNDDPALIANNFAIEEGSSLTLTPTQLSATDTDTPPDDLIFSVSNVINGQFEVVSAPMIAITGFSQHQVTDGQIRFVHNGGEQAPSFDITVSDDDGGSSTFAANISFTNVNDDPYNSGTLSTNLTALEDTPKSVTTNTLTISDIDAGSGNLSLSITTSAGVLQAANTGALIVNGNGSDTLELTGTVSTINNWLNSATALSYTGAEHSNGSPADTIEFSIVDHGNTGIGGGTSISLGSITVDINAINDAPTGADNTVTTDEDNDYNFNIADFGFSDTIDSNGFLGLTIDAVPDRGQLLLNGSPVTANTTVTAADIGSGDLIFRPAADDNGQNYTSFTFSVQDDGGADHAGTDTDPISRTMTINVASVNDAPFGSDGQVRTTEDTAVTLSRSDFGFSDVRDHADQLSLVQIESLPVTGQLLLNNAELETGDTIAANSIELGQLVYLPAPDQSGDVSFEFRVIDNNLQPGISISQISNQLKIAIDPVSDAPSGSDGLRSTLEDTDYRFMVTDFGFTDPADNDTIIGVQIDLLPVNGKLTLRGGNVAAGDFISVNEISLGQFQYRPAVDAHGDNVDNLGFRVVDSGEIGPLNTDPLTRTLTFDVLSVNDAPSGQNNTISTHEDTDYIFSRNDFGFSDATDGDAFSLLTVTSLPEIGILLTRGIPVESGDLINVASLDAGELVYQPPLNANGTIHNAFSFTVTDNGGVALGGKDTDTSENVISIDVSGVNDSPTLIANGATLDEGDTIVIDNTMLGGTDADDPGLDELQLTITTLPEHGQILLNGEALTVGASFSLQAIESGSVSYRHDGSETSTDGFDVKLTDGGEDNSTPALGRFDLSVNEIIDAAVELSPDSLHLAHGESFDSTDGDKLLSGYSSLNRGSLIDNTVLLVELESEPTQGIVELHPDGTFTYVHNGSDVLSDAFSYRVTNEDGIFTIAIVAVTIDPPIAAALDESPPSTDTSVSYVEHPIAEAEVSSVQSSKNVIEGSPKQKTNGAALIDLTSGDSTLRFLANGAEENRRTATLSEVETRHTSQSQASDPDFTVHRQIGVKQHREQSVVTIDNELQLVSTATFDLILELKVPTPKQVTSNPDFLQGLAQLDNEFAEMDKQSGSRYTLAEETMLGMSFSITVGMLAWAMRGGALVASIMAFAPMWSFMDLGRMISAADKKNKERERNAPNEEDVRIESLFEKDE